MSRGRCDLIHNGIRRPSATAVRVRADGGLDWGVGSEEGQAWEVGYILEVEELLLRRGTKFWRGVQKKKWIQGRNTSHLEMTSGDLAISKFSRGPDWGQGWHLPQRGQSQQVLG